MEVEHINKSNIKENSNEQIPFHYPPKIQNNCSEKVYNKLNREAFYYIYNEYQKKNMKKSNYKTNLQKSNDINNKNNNNMHLSFNRSFKFIPKRKKPQNEISNSISIMRNDMANNNNSSIIDEAFIMNKNVNNQLSYHKRGNEKYSNNNLKKFPSYYNPNIPNLNLNMDNNKISFPNKLLKKPNNDIVNLSNGEKNQSFIFQRNSRHRLLSSKSYYSFNKSMKFKTFDDGRTLDNDHVKNKMNKEMKYKKEWKK